MFHYIKGNVTMQFEGGVVIESNGIGYEVFVPDNSPVYLSDINETVLVYTAMIVREDDISIYGFHSKEELELFRLLRTVSGVGAKASMAILSCMPVNEIKKAIVFEDSAALTRANGVGKKIAQRITLELKDKLGADEGLYETADKALSGSGKAEAINALISLGYTKSEAMEALAGINDENLTTEEYIKKALKNI
ncbi:MAG: Holliday junction branch migration protein RuvA [Anaerovoracaceae bacterium]|jgi:Holliday junction DNA helicase RuvA|nr:Holliday junction branch migration protein RuvA [Clostridiales bacterium]